MTTEEAVALAESEFWKHLSPKEIASFQLWEDKLCMPFDVFHKAIEEVLGRSVWTHEFGLNSDGLKRELLGEEQPLSFQEIMELIPEEKRIIIQLD